ncbi:MAG TPA: phage terminase large subunit [Acidobacteriaceae bacterium]|nr:phage terminase large subunit [Acidobacteriaceae bacterium]
MSAVAQVFDLAAHWTPTPKNEQIRRSEATNRLRVGGTGSSKSSDALMEALEYMLRYDGIAVLFIRRQLKDLKKSSVLDWKEFVPEELYHWDGTDFVATLHHNGSKLFFGHLPNNSEKDLQQYLSAAFPVIILDECGQFSGPSWDFLSSRNRVNRECKGDQNGHMPIPVMLGCTNPIGPYWAFYKSQFVDKKPYDAPEDACRDKNGLYWVPDARETSGYRLIYDPSDWDYVHSTILDNTYLLQRDPDQLAKLERLPEPMRSKFLLGQLDTTVGQYFDCWDEARHVIDLAADPTAIIWQEWQPRWMGWDYGRAHWNAEFWFTMALVRSAGGEYKEKCVVYREYLDRGKTSKETVPNTKQLNSSGLPNPGENDMQKREQFRAKTISLRTIFFSHEKFNRSSERREKLSIAERISVRLRKAGLPILEPNDATSGSRIKKATLLYEKLENDELVVLATCRNLIESIPQLVQNPDEPEDVLKVDGKADDCYDGLTMGLYNWDTVKAMPFAVMVERKVEAARRESGNTAAAMVHMQEMAKRKGRERWGRQY